MAKRYQRKDDDVLKKAKQHINSLFKNTAECPEYADRYVQLARKIAMKFKIRLTSEQKRRFCPHCYKYLVPGKNLRVRVHEHRVIYYCLECKKFWRKRLD